MYAAVVNYDLGGDRMRIPVFLFVYFVVQMIPAYYMMARGAWYRGEGVGEQANGGLDTTRTG